MRCVWIFRIQDGEVPLGRPQWAPSGLRGKRDWSLLALILRVPDGVPGAGTRQRPRSANTKQYAKECLRWAAEAETEEDRKALLDLARDWTLAAVRLWRFKTARLAAQRL
jgi:hypothetical protein